MKDKKELFEKQLNYITSNFEIDLQRLIKTRSYISMSENVINEEIESLRKISAEFEEKLKKLVMQTLELERDFSSGISSGALNSDESFKSLKNNLNNYIALTESFINDLESRGKESTGKLESLRSYYLMELEASREELDSRIKSLQFSFSNILDGEKPEVENYHEQIARREKGFKSDLERVVSSEPAGSGEEFKSDIKRSFPDSGENEEIPYKSAVFEIGKYRQNSNGKWNRLFSSLIFIGILAACILVFILYNKDYSKQKLAEESFRESRVEETGVDTAGIVASGKTESAELPDNKETVENMPPDSEVRTEVIENITDQIKAASQKLENEFPSPDNGQKESGKNFELTGLGANVRSGPGTGYAVLTTVRKGDSIKGLNESSGQWKKIQLQDGREGWISGKLLREAKPAVKKPLEKGNTFTLKGVAANVRTGPGTGYDVLSVVKKGEVFEGLNEKSRHWEKIQLNNGTQGWISGKLIKETNP